MNKPIKIQMALTPKEEIEIIYQVVDKHLEKYLGEIETLKQRICELETEREQWQKQTNNG